LQQVSLVLDVTDLLVLGNFLLLHRLHSKKLSRFAMLDEENATEVALFACENQPTVALTQNRTCASSSTSLKSSSTASFNAFACVVATANFAPNKSRLMSFKSCFDGEGDLRVF
jgi:hypothetical protein